MSDTCHSFLRAEAINNLSDCLTGEKFGMSGEAEVGAGFYVNQSHDFLGTGGEVIIARLFHGHGIPYYSDGSTKN